MIQGTTPTHKFMIPFSKDMIEEIHIIYAQNGSPVFVKKLADCTIDGNIIQTKLTQDETFKLKHEYNADIQIRVKDVNGDVFGSIPATVSVDQCLEGIVVI